MRGLNFIKKLSMLNKIWLSLTTKRLCRINGYAIQFKHYLSYTIKNYTLKIKNYLKLFKATQYKSLVLFKCTVNFYMFCIIALILYVFYNIFDFINELKFLTLIKFIIIIILIIIHLYLFFYSKILDSIEKTEAAHPDGGGFSLFNRI